MSVVTSVNITTPQNGATVKGEISFEARVIVDTPTATVYYFIDDQFLGSMFPRPDVSNLWTSAINTAQYSQGQHELSVYAWNHRDPPTGGEDHVTVTFNQDVPDGNGGNGAAGGMGAVLIIGVLLLLAALAEGGRR